MSYAPYRTGLTPSGWDLCSRQCRRLTIKVYSFIANSPTDLKVNINESRLHGISNVRVVDASVLPRPISGNPNAVIAAIAMRAASWILKDELQND